MAARERTDFGWEVGERLGEIGDALRAGDPAQATRLWARLIAARSDELMRYHCAYEILLELRRFDEAEAFTAEALRRYGATPGRMEAHARVAQRRGAKDEALRRWEAMRKKFRAVAVSYVQGAVCLADLGRIDDAEVLLTRAVRRFPDDVFAHIERARLAVRRRDWPEALHRWAVVRTRLGHSAGVLGSAQALQELGRLPEAEAILVSAVASEPLSLEFASEFACVAERSGDATEALRRWANVRRRFPLSWVGYREEASALRAAKRFEEAEIVLLEAMGRFPHDPEVSYAFAMLATEQQDWPAAVARWASFRVAFSDRREGYERGAEALDAMGCNEEAAALRASPASD